MSSTASTPGDLVYDTDQPAGSRSMVVCVCVGLVVIIWLLFSQTLGHEFINYDDPAYVTENAEVTKGLTLQGIAWAFTHTHSHNWHPVTTISHMIDCDLYGIEPAGHHFTNVLLHAIATTILFLVFRAITDRLWRSAFVAAVFAVHPLHVESVAWVAERKDVLSGVFFMLTLTAYVWYSRSPSAGKYSLVGLLFILGLMSKPMLVTMPIVLLLLDYWPLKRVSKRPLKCLVIEKIPLLILSAISCVVTLLVQPQGLHVLFPLWVRGYTVIVNYAAYIKQLFWPVRLAILYPYPLGILSAWRLVAAATLLSVITMAAIKLRKGYPYFITGWLWYLVMLVPVIGLVPVGIQGRADRYTYLPHIGLYFLVTWGVSDLCVRSQRRRALASVAAAVMIVLLSWRTWIQASYWKDSVSIWSRTASLITDNVSIHRQLAFALLDKGRFDEAIPEFELTLKLPNDLSITEGPSVIAVVHYGLANALSQVGEWDKASFHYSKITEWNPGYEHAGLNLGYALYRAGRTDEAVAAWQKTLAAHHDEGGVFNNLAGLLATCSDPVIIRKLAATYAEAGQFEDAINAAQKALGLAESDHNSVLTDQLRMDIDRYRASRTMPPSP